jgi:flagellar basal-body rod protein FlgB
MIEALFHQPGYVAARKALDAVALRHEALAANIANVETPGYRRLDLAPSFKTELERACAGGDAGQIAALTPSLAVDSTALKTSPDGNNVNVEHELMQLNQNSLLHTLESNLITGALLRLKLAITGRFS